MRRRRTLPAVIVFGFLLLISAASAGAATSEWVLTGSPLGTGAGPLLTLADGTVLLFGRLVLGAGSAGATVEQYHPETSDWTTGGSLQVLGVGGSTVTLLPSGVVLVTGGEISSGRTSVAELYDPATRMSQITGSMHFARTGHQATLLLSGKVLVSGGIGPDDQLVGPAEVYDPINGTWSLTGVLNNFRTTHAAVLLPSGEVFVAGGDPHRPHEGGGLTSAEIYDPIGGTWRLTRSMERSRFPASGVLVPDGRVLVAGVTPFPDPGSGLVSSELYDPVTDTWAAIAPIGQGACGGSSQLVLSVLRDGSPMIVVSPPLEGTCPGEDQVTAIFDLQAEAWTITVSPGGFVASMAALPDGQALAIIAPPRVVGSVTTTALLFRRDNTTPRLVVSPLTVDFGKTSAGVAVQRLLSLQNTGGSTLTGDATTAAPFSVVFGSPFTLAPGASTTVVVQFNPSGFGTFSDVVQFTSNGNGLSVPVTGGTGVQLSGRVTDTAGTGVGGVTVDLHGASSASTVTDTAGQYRFFVSPNNGYTVTPTGPGLMFTPNTLSVIVGTQDVSGLDFTAMFADFLGIYRPSTNTFFLRNSNSAGAPDFIIYFGAPGDLPVVGDWDGTGTTTIGLYRPSSNTFFLRNSNGAGPPDSIITFGAPDDLPIVGDFDGNGTTTIGIYRPSTNTFFLRNSNSAGPPDFIIPFGAPGDLPLLGDWDGNGTYTIGIYRPSTNTFFLRNSNSAGDPDFIIYFGAPGDLPVVGDWDGNGTTTIGIYRPSTNTFFLRNSNSAGPPDLIISYGAPGDLPVVGAWGP